FSSRTATNTLRRTSRSPSSTLPANPKKLSGTTPNTICRFPQPVRTAVPGWRNNLVCIRNVSPKLFGVRRPSALSQAATRRNDLGESARKRRSRPCGLKRRVLAGQNSETQHIISPVPELKFRSAWRSSLSWVDRWDQFTQLEWTVGQESRWYWNCRIRVRPYHANSRIQRLHRRPRGRHRQPSTWERRKSR